MRILTIAILLALFVPESQPQSAAPAPGKIYTYYVAGNAYVWKSIVIDAPLSLSVDASGQAHLASPAPQTPSVVVDEVPAAQASGGWTLLHSPKALACYRNGLRNLMGSDYTLSGSTITSQYWQPGDAK